MKFFLVVTIILLSINILAETTSNNFKDLIQEIYKINTYVEKNNLPIKQLTFDLFEKSVNSQIKFLFPKENRTKLEYVIQNKKLFPEMELFTVENPQSTFFAIHLNLNKNITTGWIPTIAIIYGNEIYIPDPTTLAECNTHINLCSEPIFFPNLIEASSSIPKFDYEIKKIQVRFTKEQIKERPEVANVITDSLQILIKVNNASIQEIVTYFGRGQDPRTLTKHLFDRLNNQKELVIDLKEIMPPAVRDGLYRYPTASLGEFDVCYNAASTFYNLNHKQGNNSTELLESIINKYYCKRNSMQSARFGDIVYSGGHAIRYIMYDSKTDKNIYYEMDSGGSSPWRLVYLDMIYYQSFHITDNQAFNTLFDVYYRCR